ncbi:MAG: hypothetical protein AAGH79_08590 [Bacteroidota bacterium]
MQRFLIFFLFLAACQRPSSPLRVESGFYHWQALSRLDSNRIEVLKRPEMGPLYLRLFDIDWDEQWQTAIPVGSLQPELFPSLPDLTVVPTFFLTNRTFRHLKKEDLDALIEAMLEKTDGLLQELDLGQIKLWQIDCDWTESTRQLFFEFCTRLRDRLQERGIILSATIRLHQLKYSDRTGIPPVDRGTLMVYNTGKISEPATKNSILDLLEVTPYLDKSDNYPLQLDLALPIFAWALVFREGKLVRILNPLPPELEQDTSRFLAEEDTWVAVKRSTFLNGYYLYAGDRIRLERIAESELRDLAALLAEKLPAADRQILFYHLDEHNLEAYSPQFWLPILEQFQTP